MNDINERLVVLRKNLGISQLEFANNLNIKRQTVAHLEGKNVALSVELLKSICQFYKVNETWLLYGTGEMLTDVKPYTAVDLHKVTNDGVMLVNGANPADVKQLTGHLTWSSFEHYVKSIKSLTPVDLTNKFTISI